ncbi:MAG: hypothetical protein ACI883_001763, partial [Candidatus Azotimanducaceae bacterium]
MFSTLKTDRVSSTYFRIRTESETEQNEKADFADASRRLGVFGFRCS